jgi:hypothetical protein
MVLSSKGIYLDSLVIILMHQMEAFEIEGFCIEIGVNNLNTEHGKKKKKVECPAQCLRGH